MNIILGILGLLLIIKEIGFGWLIDITMSIFNLYKVLNENFTIKGWIMAQCKRVIIDNLWVFVTIASIFIVSYLIVKLAEYMKKRKKKDCR